MIIELKHVKKIYDKNGIEVVKDFNLKIEDKEFIVFVGPSGCGKSTTLRMIAGLEDITGGTISFDGKVINDLLPGERNIAMVFQSYALYPNMTVYKNMEFPLKIKKPSSKVDGKFSFKKWLENHSAKEVKARKLERREKIMQVSNMLGLDEYLKRKPKNLSGGQRQRVAVGREIVRDCNLFLFDEPLSNLDAKLRVQMRTELTALHKQLQKTFIYVTHDQVEAMTMATRIVIMYNGIVQQVGTPKEVYDNPENMFVAGFIGTPAMNFIKGKVSEDGYFEAKDEKKIEELEQCEDPIEQPLELLEMKVKIPEAKFNVLKENGYVGKEVVLGIRPENILEEEHLPETGLEIPVLNAELLGFEYNLIMNVCGSQIISRIVANKIIKSGDNVKLYLDLNKAHFFDSETTNVIK